MLERLAKWLLGEKLLSSATGLFIGAVSGAVTVVATGNLSKEALLIGAAGGTVAALSGNVGRTTGEVR